jgi:serine/threonine-protein kinase
VKTRYRLLERIGSGGTADVYRARDERLKRDVAVKVIVDWLVDDAPTLRRFRREAELGVRLSHPNVVAVLDAGSRPRAHIVMELVEGVDSQALLKAGAWLDTTRVVRLLADVCAALDHAHALGVIHGDVAPRNILLRRSDGVAKLADFGLAADALEGATPASVTGTPRYVAPELLAGSAPAPRCDLYSVAAVAYGLLVGPPQLRVAQLTAVPRRRPLREVRSDVPRRLAAAIDRALAPNPADRQRSVAQFRDELLAGQGRAALLRAA